MDQLIDSVLMDLVEFRALGRLSRSAERKHRREAQDWPPHLTIGRKVFYRRAVVMDWLARQEAKEVSAR